jgi:hypothetical protein
LSSKKGRLLSVSLFFLEVVLFPFGTNI